MLTTVGTGTFGRVRMVQYKPTKQFFAMKILKKSEVCTAAALFLSMRPSLSIVGTLRQLPHAVGALLCFFTQRALCT